MKLQNQGVAMSQNQGVSTNQLSSATVMKTFREVAETHPLWNHDFLHHCRAGELTLQEVRVLAVQMYKFSKEFNRILASVMARCPDTSAQAVILDNLFDEMGEGDPDRAHPELFRHFTRALGIDDETLESIPATPETQALIDTYLALADRYGYVAGLGAICFASEGIVNSLYTQIQNGIVGAARFSKEALVFFDVHIHLDDDHAAQLAALVEPRVHSIEEAMYVNRAILEALDARCQFFNGVQRQALQSKRPERSLICA